MHAFNHDEGDPSTAFAGMLAEISMYQNAVNVSYSRTFD